jgi:hypothetical protein
MSPTKRVGHVELKSRRSLSSARRRESPENSEVLALELFDPLRCFIIEQARKQLTLGKITDEVEA